MNVNGYNLQVGVYANTDPATIEIKKFLADAKKTSDIKLDIKFNSQGRQAINQVKTATGELVTITKQYDRQGQLVDVTVNKLSRDYKSLTNATRQQQQAQQNLNATAHNSVSIFQDFTNTFLKMAKFNTINLIYDSLTNSIANAVTVVKEFNDATTELRKVSDLEGESLKNYAQDLADYGAEVGRTMTDMVNSATIFKRTGATDEEAKNLAKIAEMYRNVADSEISSAEASQFLVSQMKAFNIAAQDSIHIIDAINNTANHFAVSTDDLQKGLSKASASLATAGNTYEESIALIESATAIMQNQAGTVGNGFRTIAINIANLAAKSDEFVDASGKVKIALKDEQGQLRSTYAILNDLYEQWDKLTPVEQNSIAVALAGKTRYNVLTSSMRNFADAQKVLQTAYNSTNSAIEENARYMESISAKINRLQEEYQKFILGDGGLEAFEKAILDIGIGIAQLLNNLGGLQNVFTALITTGLLVAIKHFETLSKTISNGIGVFTRFGQSISETINKWIELQINESLYIETTDAAIITTNMLKLSLSTLVVVLGVVAMAFQAYQHHQEQLAEASKKASKEALAQVDSINAQLTSLEKENQSREDLIKAIQAVDGAYKDEGQTLDELNKKRQESIDKIKEESQAKLEDAKQSGLAQYRKDLTTLNKSYSPLKQIGIEADIHGVNLNTNGLANYINSLKELRKIENEAGVDTSHLNVLINELETTYNEAKTNVDNYNGVLLTLGQVYDTVTNKIRALLPSEIAQTDTTYESIDAMEQQKGILEELGTSLEKVWDVLDESGQDKLLELMSNNDIEGVIELLQQYGIEIANANNQTDEAVNIWDEFLDNIEGVQSAYEILTKAADEYNQNGFITASTLKQLNKLSPEYLAILAQEGDTYENINSALGDYLDKEKEQAIQKVNLARYTSILELCENTLKEQTEKTNKVIEDSGTKANEASEGYDELGNAAIRAAIGMKAVEDGGLDTDEFYEKFNKINNYFDSLVDNINKTNLGATKSSKSAAGSSKDAWVEAFEEEQRQLKHSLEMNEITELEYYERLKDLNEKYFGEISGNHQKYIKEYQENEEEIYKGLKSVYDKVADYLSDAIQQGYEDAINAIKKEEKQIVDEIKSQIDSLKQEKKDVLDDIERQIKTLKNKKDQVQEYWDSQIDKIKESNDALQKQNELLEKQQALQQAKSQKVMVMKNGKFQLGENESAVAQAEQALAETQDKISYEQQIAEMEKMRDAEIKLIDERIEKLEAHKDYMEEYYDEQIEALERYSEEVQKQYDKQIEDLQEQLDSFKTGAEQQKKIEEARLAAQVIGINNEADLFKISLANLKAYIEQYNALVDAQKSIGEKSSGVIPSGEASFITAAHQPIVSGIENVSTQVRASGDASFKGDEIALVGESPNAELVLGAHLNRSVNSGSLIHLSKGSGVVNAESTATLAGLLNGVVKPNNTANNRSVIQTFTFENLTLPNVTDSNSFVNALSHKFNNYAIQYGNRR